MPSLTFDTLEVLLRLEHGGNDEGTPVITLKLHLAPTPIVYVSSGQKLQQSRWTMVVTGGPSGDDKREVGSLTYADVDGKGECLVSVEQSESRFRELVDMFKGGHASEITVVTEGMAKRDDYSSQWDTDRVPKLNVLSVSFEFPLPQSEA